MRLTHGTTKSLTANAPMLALLVDSVRAKELPVAALGQRAIALMRKGVFSGKPGQTLVLHSEEKSGPKALLLIGMGKAADASASDYRHAGMIAGREATALDLTAVTVATAGKLDFDKDTLSACGEGLVMSSYRYPLKEADHKPLSSATVVSSVKGAAAVLTAANAVAEGTNLARELGDLPANIAHPTYLRNVAAKLCSKGKLGFKAHNTKALERMKMGGILAVGQGSAHESYLIEMDYKPASYKHTICIVGKGLTFDSGGISIKPSGGMEEMRYDMCGAAATIGLMAAIARTRPKGVRVIGIVGAAENMPSSTAYRPGDVVTTGSGKTIEVINTDAEGRVVLADALHLATLKKPDAIIDMATLTGAIVVALGHEAAGLFCRDDSLSEKLMGASKRSDEKLWPMPTYDAYSEKVKSRWADIRNSAGREAGSCTAAAFLFNFTEGVPHAHLDVAGAAWEMKTRQGMPPGARGFGVRLLHDAVQNWTR
ncbi:MAG: leucyl aminopeptidase [Pseudohongiellaceae bacterium]|jgi:leucyl aminopeptidase